MGCAHTVTEQLAYQPLQLLVFNVHEFIFDVV